MVRIHAPLVTHKAALEHASFLKNKALYWLKEKNFVLAADYAIHALNLKSSDPLALFIALIASKEINETQFYSKCHENLDKLKRKFHLNDQIDLLDSNPLGGSIKQMIEDNVRELPPSLGVEYLGVENRAPINGLRSEVQQAAQILNPNPYVELLDVPESGYGKGIYASRFIPKDTPVLLDQASFTMPYTDEVCAYCLRKIEHTDTGISCQSCHERYCSVTCKQTAWVKYHQCICARINPQYALWEDSLRRNLKSFTSDGAALNSSAELLRCLAVGRICAIATIKEQCPLSLPEFRGLKATIEYSKYSTLGNLGAFTIQLAFILHQKQLYLEDILIILGMLQTNEFSSSAGISLFPILSFLNHSCLPNAKLTGDSHVEKKLVTTANVAKGGQLFINYNSSMCDSLPYEARRKLIQQRHFECFCLKCTQRL